MRDFLELVKKERQKQISKHGYTHDHDDEHTDGGIADAAACYAATVYIWREDSEEAGEASPVWPWDAEYLKKEEKTRKEQIIIACAMLMAEYERLERLETK